MRYKKSISAVLTLILGMFLFCPSANAIPRTRRSTAALAGYAQPGDAKGSYGTPKQLAKVIKARKKAHKKALKKYKKELKKAQKLAKKRAKEREKKRKKEAKRRKKLRKEMLRKKRREERLKALAEEEGADEGSEDIDGSVIVKDDPAKEERSFFSKLTNKDKYKGKTNKRKYGRNKLDRSKLSWWSRLFLDWFGS